MKVNRRSWHWKLYTTFEYDEPTSVCKYFGTLLASPVICLVGASLFVMFLPVIAFTWLAELVENYIPKWDFSLRCPLGKVEAVEPAELVRGGKSNGE